MAPQSRVPVRHRTYQNHHLDSTRWDYFTPRPGDIVIASPYKSGTTWVQGIVANLLFQDGDFPVSVGQMSPWLDHRSRPLELVLNNLASQRHRRFIKSHLPLDGFAYRAEYRILFVARDPRDAFMSLWNHYSRHVDGAFERLNSIPGRVGGEFPHPPADIHAFWHDWITRGWFPWEHDGYPYWSLLSQVQSWWDYRHLSNVLFVRYRELLADTVGQIRRIAAFLDIDVTKEGLEEVSRRVSFAEMKRAGTRYAPGEGANWEGGADTFFHRGIDGRWRDVLDAGELALYDAACERVLDAECRAWLESGAPG